MKVKSRLLAFIVAMIMVLQPLSAINVFAVENGGDYYQNGNGEDYYTGADDNDTYPSYPEDEEGYNDYDEADENDEDEQELDEEYEEYEEEEEEYQPLFPEIGGRVPPNVADGFVAAMEVGTWAGNDAMPRYFTFGEFNGHDLAWRVLEVFEGGTALLLLDDVLLDVDGDALVMTYMEAHDLARDLLDLPYRAFLLEEEETANRQHFAGDDLVASAPWWLVWEFDANRLVVDSYGEVVEAYADGYGVRFAMYVDLWSGSFDGVEYFVRGQEVEVGEWLAVRVNPTPASAPLFFPECETLEDDRQDDDELELVWNRVAGPSREIGIFPISSREHFFGATRSAGTLGVANPGNQIYIDRVQVMRGGQYLAGWRTHTGGDAITQNRTDVSGANIAGWFSDARNASFTEERNFVFHTYFTPAQVGTNPSVFLDSLEYRFGGLAFDVWEGGQFFNGYISVPGVGMVGGQPDLVEFVSDRIIRVGAYYVVETTVKFNKSHPGLAAGLNVPFDGFGDVNQPGFGLMRNVIGNFDFTVYTGTPSVANRAASIPVRMSQNDYLRTWWEIVDWIHDLRSEAGSNRTINGRHVDVQSIGQSYRGRNIYQVIVARNAAAVDNYLNNTRPMMSDSIASVAQLRREVMEDIQAGRRPRHKLPVAFTNIHADEVAGVDAQLVMLERILRDNYLTFHVPNSYENVMSAWPAWWGVQNRTERVGDNTTEIRINVNQLLDHFIFLFIPTNNPDGHYYMRRGTWHGFDTNRDGSYQIHPETRALTTNLARWLPIAQLDLHGHVRMNLIEPTTGPHNLNNEYDLLTPWMLESAHAMGIASIAGAFSSYMIPLQHWSEDWDDAGPLYLPVFMTMFGIKGFTVEFPGTSTDSVHATVSYGWGYLDFALDNFAGLFNMRLDFAERGLRNYDARSTDPWFAYRGSATLAAAQTAANASFNATNNPLATIPVGSTLYPEIGRQLVREENGGRFFPDWWVIPVDTGNQFNMREAFYTVGKFANHGVRIDRTTRSITHGGTVYPAGTLVVDMRQVTRGYVNSMLSAGSNPHMYFMLYAETEINFPSARGFRADAVWAPGLFSGALQTLDLANHDGPDVRMPATQLAPGGSPYLVIKNNSVDAVRLVNNLLSANVNVWMLTEHTPGAMISDFVVQRSALTPARLSGLFIETIPLQGTATAQPLVRPRLTVLENWVDQPTSAANSATQGGQSNWQPPHFGIEQMGFDFTLVPNNDTLATVSAASMDVLVVPGQDWDDITRLANEGVPIVAVGGPQNTMPAMTMVENLLPGLAGAWTMGMGLGQAATFDAEFNTASPITARFNQHDRIYLRGARGFTSIPDGTMPLIQIPAGSFDDVYHGGFIPGAMQANFPGRIFAFTGETSNGVPVTYFGPNIFSRGHTRMYWNMFANAVFMHTAGIPTIIGIPYIEAVPLPGPYTARPIRLVPAASTIEGSTAIVEQFWIKISESRNVATFQPPAIQAATLGTTLQRDVWHLVDAADATVIINQYREFIHWFVLNSYGETNQGVLDFGVPGDVPNLDRYVPREPALPRPPTGGNRRTSSTPQRQVAQRTPETIPAANGQIQVPIRTSLNTVTLVLTNELTAQIIENSTTTANFNLRNVADNITSVSVPGRQLLTLANANLYVQFDLPQGTVTIDAIAARYLAQIANTRSIIFTLDDQTGLVTVRIGQDVIAEFDGEIVVTNWTAPVIEDDEDEAEEAQPEPIPLPITPLPIQVQQPVTVNQNQAFIITSGPQAGQAINPPFEMVAFGGGEYASAFIAAAAIGDILGWQNAWNPELQQGTFFLPDGRTVVFTNGSNVVYVDGVQHFKQNADGSEAVAYISNANDRFMIHIRFFEVLNVNIDWHGGVVGNNSFSVRP